MGVEMLVDPQVLRALAGQVDSAATKITDADVGNITSSAADGPARFDDPVGDACCR
jgi:hypothetical protein